MFQSPQTGQHLRDCCNEGGVEQPENDMHRDVRAQSTQVVLKLDGIAKEVSSALFATTDLRSRGHNI